MPKGSAPFYQLITDASFGITVYSDWDVAYTSASDLSAALHFRDFTWSADLENAYHLSVFAGCCGTLRPCKQPVVAGDGQGPCINSYMVSCTPSTCLSGCDKDLSGISLHGLLFRFAACQFGLKIAGSSNCLVMSVARYFARLPTSVHVAAWVDDLHFSTRIPAHPACAGHAGGCPACTTAFEAAVVMEALWRAKTVRVTFLGLRGRGIRSHRGGAFTGIHIDTWLCQYLMLPTKLESVRGTISGLASTDLSTPRLQARGRGRASHYGCAMQFLAAICPSLSPAIHQAETAYASPPPSLTEEQNDTSFDWDLPLEVSTRTRAALQLMNLILVRYGSACLPIWPVPPASLFWAFCAWQLQEPAQATVVLLAHAGSAGRAATLGHPCSRPQTQPPCFGGAGLVATPC